MGIKRERETVVGTRAYKNVLVIDRVMKKRDSLPRLFLFIEEG